MPIILQNIIRFILLVLFQVLVLNNIQFLGYINPYVYVLFILALPVRTPEWMTLIFAFVLGFIIDMFSNTGGMHASSIVLIAFVRLRVIKLFTAIEEGSNPSPSFYTFGVSAYIKYTVLLVVIHHAVLFFIETFTVVGIWFTVAKILLSSLVSILLILGIQLLKRK